MDLIDIPTIRNSFCWSNAVGGVAYRINMILLSEGAIEAWNIVRQEIGARDIFDHILVWSKSSNLNWGPKPFQDIQGRLTNDRFMEFVKAEWNSFNIVGKKTYIIKEKFKLLRERIRWWNKEVYGWLDLKVERDVTKLNYMDDYLLNDNNVVIEDDKLEWMKPQGMFGKL